MKYEQAAVLMNRLGGALREFNTPLVPCGALAGLVDKETIKSAFFGSLVSDSRLLRSMVPSTPGIPVIQYLNSPTHEHEDGIDFQGAGRTTVYPYVGMFGAFHPKFMLLDHRDYLRVVVGSSNMTQFETDSLDQVFYVQDFHRKISTTPRGTATMGEDLDRFLLKFQAKTAAAVVRQFDLSTAKATLVTSAPGMRSIDNMLMGLPRLGEAIRKIDPEDKGGPLLYTCSSIGKLDEKWMWDFYMSVYPDYAKAGAAEFEGLPPVTVLYPSADTVKGHEGASNFVWFNKAYYEDKTFPRSILRDVVSRRKTVIHAKILCPDSPDPKWFYIGSHNMSAAAWGKAVVSNIKATTGAGKLVDAPVPISMTNRIANYEMGVIFATADIPFDHPYEYPPQRYAEGQLPHLHTEDPGKRTDPKGNRIYRNVPF